MTKEQMSKREKIQQRKEAIEKRSNREKEAIWNI